MEKRRRTPQRRSSQLEDDISSYKILAQPPKDECELTKAFPLIRMLSDGRTSHKLYTGPEIKALQRKLKPRYYSVDRRDEDLSTSRLSSRCLFGRRSLASVSRITVMHTNIASIT